MNAREANKLMKLTRENAVQKELNGIFAEIKEALDVGLDNINKDIKYGEDTTSLLRELNYLVTNNITSYPLATSVNISWRNV